MKVHPLAKEILKDASEFAKTKGSGDCYQPFGFKALVENLAWKVAENDDAVEARKRLAALAVSDVDYSRR